MQCVGRRPPPRLPSAIYKRTGHQLIVIIRQWLLQCCVVCPLTNRQESTMQTSTVVVLLCLIAAVAVRAQQEPAPEAAADQYLLDTPLHDRSPRNKRGLLLLKKKLLLGALGIKAAKIGAVGAGVAGALALKAKSKPKAVTHTSYYHHGDLPLVIRY
ncbi:hypothetical protein PYW08_006912 [Mythimna loreyi]|uniref:Uncharacterized protein n=1 Tax=Mythimna loreyi TaxID=667449 RepID=A0ACC2R8L2_9NEOP|nr:hypothetical protein PYW08_006912 [Mythimna loreyi]